MVNLFGSITMFLAIIMVVIAFPSQIKKNHKEKKCGFSFLMVILPLAIYVSRTIYSVMIKSWYIMIPDILGILVSSILLVQFFWYRRNR